MNSTFDNEDLSKFHSGPLGQAPSPCAETDDMSEIPNDSQIRIKQYTIGRILGEGTFGMVKLALHRISGHEVALKVIPRERLDSQIRADRVKREIQFLQFLRHPHIIKLYTTITIPTSIMMVLEYAEGELLDYLVQHRRLTEAKARRFFQQIICGVEYCHRHGIVHRDLKPENLLLDSSLNIKIIDFGLSNVMTEGTLLKTTCGSPNYAAPEILCGKAYVGPEVDVWSCGIILYVMLVGDFPFDSDDLPTLYEDIAAGNYSSPNYLPLAPKNLIRKMLKIDQVQRITIPEIRQYSWFNTDIEEYLKQPIQEHVDMIADANTAIEPHPLAQMKRPAIQVQMHDSVIDKLKERMGIDKEDILKALGSDRPNAIKDAYLIIRENHVMPSNRESDSSNVV